MDTFFEALSLQAAVTVSFWAAKVEIIITRLLAIVAAYPPFRIFKSADRTCPSVNIATVRKGLPNFFTRRPSKRNGFSLDVPVIVGIHPPGA
jgi:hypothetical protein